ncbi:hypothetical protein Tco_0802285 [Tanacetum coccineum]|uniref:Copia protein n=1 Tax=Tanacetum coccineum TaxID=301880 RepID=A0ABQ5A211_9ASTR
MAVPFCPCVTKSQICTSDWYFRWLRARKESVRNRQQITRKIIETIHGTFDELTAMASEQFSLGPGLHTMTPATSSSGLVPNLIPQQPCIPPLRDDWDHLFQPMFDEYFTPPSIAVSPVQEAAALRAVVLADSLMSTSIDQDAPSSSTPSIQEQEQSPNISQGFEESPKTPIFCDDPLNESPHKESTSQGSSSNVRQTYTLFKHLGKWTNDHIIANVIGDPSRSVSTRNDSVDTPTVEKSNLDEDLQGKPVDATLYRGMIGFPYMQISGCRTLDPVHQECSILGDKLVSWSSKKQKCTAISSTEAEYIGLFGCCAQIQWMRSQLTYYGFQFNKIPLYCDNKSAIALCCNNV